VDTESLITVSSSVLEIVGVTVITIGILLFSCAAVVRLVRKKTLETAYRDYRRQVGRSILLGLELLVAADIIQTVAVKLTFTSVGVLAAVVAIRTFLSFTLEAEISGRWPWQAHSNSET